MPEPTFTMPQVAAMLGMSVRSLQRLHRAGDGPARKRDGREWEYSHAALVHYLKSKEKAPQQGGAEELFDNAQINRLQDKKQ